MTQLINFLFVGLIIISCKDLSEKKAADSQIDNQIKLDSSIIKKSKEKISDDTIPDVNGRWVCYQYVSDDRVPKKNGDYAAQEITRFANFQIQNNSLFIGDCKKEIYTYKFAVKSRKYDDESVFITYFKPQKDTINFMGGINSGRNIPCELFDSYTFYLPEADHLIHYNDGYFYHYKKSTITPEYKSFTISGIPGNTKNEWSIEWTSTIFSSLEKGYEYFLTTFPYGSQNLKSKIPKESEFFDTKNGVSYSKKGENLYIIKDDPVGKIYITISQQESTTNFLYELKFPDYD